MANKKLFLLVAITYSIILASVSLVPNEELPYFGTNYEDKIYHVLAYALLCFLWIKVLLSFEIKRALLIALIASIIYGTILEVLQGQLTATRKASIGDIVANGVGAVVVFLFLTIKQKTSVKKL